MSVSEAANEVAKKPKGAKPRSNNASDKVDKLEDRLIEARSTGRAAEGVMGKAKPAVGEPLTPGRLLPAMSRRLRYPGQRLGAATGHIAASFLRR